MYADVLVELKTKQIDKTFTYIIPDEYINKLRIGMRVLIPFGKQKLEGFVIKIYSDKTFDYDLKQIINLVDEYPVLNEEMLELGKYIKSKTLCNLISAYQSMLPSALKAHSNFYVNKKYINFIKLIDFKYQPKNNVQEQIINLLKNNFQKKSELNKISISAVKTLLNIGVIEEYKQEVYRLNNSSENFDNKIVLNIEQQKVVDEVSKNLNKFEPYLLFGVTGSGKTEVYMNIISKVLKNKKQVIVLVPEISLTPQIVNLFKNRFGSSIAILHSALSVGEKYDEWRKIQKNEVSIVIGARSAIFAPFTNIGLIILDEEHSDTYKQDSNPRYDTIDIAIKRAKTHECPIILGSATPSIESYTRAKTGIYNLLQLKNRVNNMLPKVKLIDMRKEIKKGNRIFSSELIDDINDRLSKNEQIILLLNRRGYTTTITCKECGNTLKCPNCDIPLTYHKSHNKLNCHYCNYTTFKPTKCSECNNNIFMEFGIGTEKLEEEINNKFPLAKTVRMDVDTTRKKFSYERIINDFKNKKYNILIGTQMIAKGLDFGDVTLVGVINGDATLNIPDFRSGERTYSLLNQVSGRAGRSYKEGKVIIQGYNIDHYSIKYACNNDYEGYYNEEMKIRKKLNYPPYCNLCMIKIIGKDYDFINKKANNIKNYLYSNTKNVIVLGPSMCSIPKTNNKYYVQIILKYKKIIDIYESLKFILEKEKSNNKIILDLDFNPKKI